MHEFVVFRHPKIIHIESVSPIPPPFTWRQKFSYDPEIFTWNASQENQDHHKLPLILQKGCSIAAILQDANALFYNENTTNSYFANNDNVNMPMGYGTYEGKWQSNQDVGERYKYRLLQVEFGDVMLVREDLAKYFPHAYKV